MTTFYSAAELAEGRALRAENPEFGLFTDREMAALIRYARTPTARKEHP